MFVPGSKIMQEDGTETAIALLEIGDWVLDANLNPVQVIDIVTTEDEKEILLTYYQDHGISVVEGSARQKVVTTRGEVSLDRLSWKDSINICVRQRIMRTTLAGLGISIYNGELYSLRTKGSNTYLVNRIAVVGT